MDLDKSVDIDLSQDSAHVQLRSAAHSKAAATWVVHIWPVGDETRYIVGGSRHWLCAYHNLPSIFSFVHQLSLPCLTGCTHKWAHGDFCLTDKIKLRTSVVVNVDHLKLELLLALKVVRDSKTGLKVRVEVVHDDFSLSNLLPAIALLLIQDAPWVRLAEVVKILKLASWDEEIDTLVQARVCLLNHFKYFLKRYSF